MTTPLRNHVPVYDELLADRDRLKAENRALADGGAAWAQNAELFRQEIDRLKAELAAARIVVEAARRLRDAIALAALKEG
jgi:hypothetical protein